MDDQAKLDAVGWLRDQMQDDDIARTVIAVCHGHGHADIGVFAFNDWPKFQVLVEGIRDLVEQSPE